MTGDPIRTHVLSVQYIPNVDEGLRRGLRIGAGARSLGILTTDSDDPSYAALDEATKKADVRVAYAKSMYAGAGNASMRLAGEFIGILAGPDPESVRSGMEAAVAYLERDACFYSADEEDRVAYFAHCIARTGSYLSQTAGVPKGTALAYLIAPPSEAICGLDAALKAAEVSLARFYGPPTETNFAGGLLAGDQPACQAACEAFAAKVLEVSRQPIQE